MAIAEVVPNIFLVPDTCNVYVLRDGHKAICIDFGSGSVLDRLGELEVDGVTDILMTHHHRDQGQGLGRASDLGIRIWVPPAERELFDSVDQHWQTRGLDCDYDLMLDKFSLLEPVAVAGCVDEYAGRTYGTWRVCALPTPGHTVGSISYMVKVGERCVIFVGDLLYSATKVWSLATMQWSYNGLEGAAMTIASLTSLKEHSPDVLLPSHGSPTTEPVIAIETVANGLQELLEHRPTSKGFHIGARELAKWVDHPYQHVSEHLLMNRTSWAISYCLLSQDATGLLFDYGYDMTGGLPTPTARYARRPWLGSMPALHRDYGVERLEVVMPTHYHDDHVAGFNLLRQSEGAQVWAGENIAPVLNEPTRFDLPCLWYEPIAVDRVLPLGRPVRWHEYELTLYELSGHTLYAVAIVFEVDGKRVIVSGDQQDGGWTEGYNEYLNYQYRNGFRIDDYVRSARLYHELSPDLMVSGHWAPRVVTSAYLDALLREGERIAELHRKLLPLDEVDFGAGGFGARIEPYRSRVEPGGVVRLTAVVQNPFGRRGEIVGMMVLPSGWEARPAEQRQAVEAHGTAALDFVVRTAPALVRRARIAIDMTVDGTRFGQQAEAVIDVVKE